MQVFDAKPPFALIKTFDTGPIANHVNFVSKADGEFAYVTIGGLNEVKVFRTDGFLTRCYHSRRGFATRHLAVR